MAALEDWKLYFETLGIKCLSIASNSSAVQLSNLTGSPVFRVVSNAFELNQLHTKARQKSSEMKRLLVVALPLSHPQTIAALPGNVVLPKVRVYGGHCADTFCIEGHTIESEFLKNIKQEVLAVMGSGTNVQTPLCEWVQKLLGNNWKYGTPSSLAQLDSMLGLLANDVARIGHVRSRQLSFGRGCGDALLLPSNSLILKNNNLQTRIETSDLRFIGLETEMKNYSAARARIHPVIADKFLSVLAHINQTNAQELGCGINVGTSVIGSMPKPQRMTVTTETVAA